MSEDRQHSNDYIRYDEFMKKILTEFSNVEFHQILQGMYNSRTFVLKGFNNKDKKYYVHKLFPIDFKEDALDYNTLPVHTVKNKLMNLDHPNIMKMTDFSGEYNFNKQGPGFGYIISIFYEGITGQEFMNKNNPKNNLSMLLNLGLGIFYMHENNLSHGDIKSENLIVSNDGKQAIIIDNELNSKKNHELNMPFGTVVIAPPEQVFDNKNKITPTTDTFSFGQLICKALNPLKFLQERCFYQNNTMSTCKLMKSSDFPDNWINLIVTKSFSDFKELLNQMLQPDHNDRIGFRDGFDQLEKIVYDHFKK